MPRLRMMMIASRPRADQRSSEDQYGRVSAHRSRRKPLVTSNMRATFQSRNELRGRTGVNGQIDRRAVTAFPSTCPRVNAWPRSLGALAHRLAHRDERQALAAQRDGQPAMLEIEGGVAEDFAPPAMHGGHVGMIV